MPVSKALIKRPSQAVTLGALKASTEIGKQTVYIFPMILFSLLVVLLHWQDGIAKFFSSSWQNYR